MKNFINSYDRVKGAIESGKAINIFNMVDGDYVGMGEFEYSDEAMIVLELVAKNGEGFVVDICNRVLESINVGKAITLSEKQRWCIAFAANKISTDKVDELHTADAEFIAMVESEEAVENTAHNNEYFENMDDNQFISIRSLLNRAEAGETISSIKLYDAGKYASNAKGDMLINTDIFFSSRVYAYRADDRLVKIGKKTLNVDELRRQLERFIGKGSAVVCIGGKCLRGEITK